jgi:hypothetical protein
VNLNYKDEALSFVEIRQIESAEFNTPLDASLFELSLSKDVNVFDYRDPNRSHTLRAKAGVTNVVEYADSVRLNDRKIHRQRPGKAILLVGVIVLIGMGVLTWYYLRRRGARHVN